MAFPTETVYGLGACVFNEDAVAQVFTLKGRPTLNPLIVHVASIQDAALVGAGWDDRCHRLADKFWPGPLTIVTKKHSKISSIVTGGRETVAVRAPSHQVAQSLLKAVGEPLVAPSANRSGHVSATTAQHVADDFPDGPLMVLDGGATDVGIESTVVDLSGPTGSPITILRQGAILASDIATVVGPVHVNQTIHQGASPGTNAQHYAPCVPLQVVSGDQLEKILRHSKGCMVVLVFEMGNVPDPHTAMVMPTTPDAYGQILYDQLRRGEAYDGIIVVEPPNNEQWGAIHDRLSRASVSVAH